MGKLFKAKAEGWCMERMRPKGRITLTLLIVLLALSLLPVPNCEGSSKPPDWASIRQGIQGVIDFLDSAAYAQLVSWDEHVVLAYKLAQGREPTPLEFFLLRACREDIGMNRSTGRPAREGTTSHLGTVPRLPQPGQGFRLSGGSGGEGSSATPFSCAAFGNYTSGQANGQTRTVRSSRETDPGGAACGRSPV